MYNYVKVLGFPFLSTSMNALVTLLENKLEKNQRTFLVTANPEILMTAENDHYYLNTVESADIIIPDGVGIILGSRLLGTPIPERLAGFDLMIEMFQLSAKKGYKIYLLGAEESVLEEAVQKAEDTFPGIQIVGYQHGFVDVDDPKVIEDIKACDPDMVFVGLGCPKQESWIGKHQHSFSKGIFVGVGGSFDVVAGRVKRAPVVWQKMKLEWMYRLIQRPSRWRRMAVLPIFAMKIIKLRYFHRKNVHEV